MFAHLEHIYDPRERLAVGVADLALSALAWPRRLMPVRAPVRAPERILLLRLERIGDLLMTLGALEAVRATWPLARVDLVVGSWNADVARRLPWVDRVDTLDAPWLSRGAAAAGIGRLLAHAARWRREGYDLALNLEGDIRTNVLLALSGAPVRVGFPMAGGGAMLTDAIPYVGGDHTDENTRRLVRAAAVRYGVTAVEPTPQWPRFSLPREAIGEAAALLNEGGATDARPLIGLHASGGRAIKQWHPERFAEAVGRLATTLGARVVLTGSRDDRALVDTVKAALPPGLDIVDVAGRADLLTLAAVLARLDLYVTGDTGPMHLAAAMGTPVVAVFGVSSPARYAPLAPRRRVVRIDIHCSPCNRVRLPPERCRGHVPDCLEGIGADMVVRAGLDLIAEVSAIRQAADDGAGLAGGGA